MSAKYTYKPTKYLYDGQTIDDADFWSDLSQDLFSSWSFASTQGNAAAPFSVFEALGSSSGASTGSAVSAAAHDAGTDITILDTVFSAKGGQGGGGGGGGGGTGLYSQYFSGSADGDKGYDIWIEFKGTGWTAALQQAFINTADYLTKVITDDIGGGGLYRGKIIDDLYVTAELKAIDGVGGILGQAGPTAVWTATELTAAGQMQFDSADAQHFYDLGLWDDIVTHEFMHVLGFGSLWNYGTNPLVSGNQYTGANALAAYQGFYPQATYIPVEDGGGSGTAGAHWDEESLTDELMTGYINTQNYLSNFSVMSLADLGYHVTYQDYPFDQWMVS
jgi:hypothetical protein